MPSRVSAEYNGYLFFSTFLNELYNKMKGKKKMKKNSVLELEDKELTEFANELSGYMSSIIKDKGLPEELTVNSSANCYNAVDMTNAAVFGLEYALDLMEKEHKADIETIRKIADEEIEKYDDALSKAINELDIDTDDSDDFSMCVKRAVEKKTIDGVTAAFLKANPDIKLDAYDDESCFKSVFGDYYAPFAQMITDIYAPTNSARKIFEENGLNFYSLDGRRIPFRYAFLHLCTFFVECGKKANAYKSAIFTSQGLKAFNEIKEYFISNYNNNLFEFCETLESFANFILKTQVADALNTIGESVSDDSKQKNRKHIFLIEFKDIKGIFKGDLARISRIMFDNTPGYDVNSQKIFIKGEENDINPNDSYYMVVNDEILNLILPIIKKYQFISKIKVEKLR